MARGGKDVTVVEQLELRPEKGAQALAHGRSCPISTAPLAEMALPLTMVCISQCITSSRCTTKKKPRLRNLAKPGLLSERRTKVRTGDPELGKVMLYQLSYHRIFPPAVHERSK
jgi:hypothetical protein